MTFEEAKEIFNLPFMELAYKAHTIHIKHFNPNEIQTSTLLSIKTGACSENCAYCAQSATNGAESKKAEILNKEEILKYAKIAKDSGSTRFCMGASGRTPSKKELDSTCEIIKEVKKLGLEVCVTLGLLDDNQAKELKQAGLDFYNHNIDTSKDFYGQVIQTRSFESRLDTLKSVRNAGLKICAGGILGLGETNEDRIKMLLELANLEIPPESIPINQLVPIPNTPLESAKSVDKFDFIRTIALARILMPTSFVRLSAGRKQMSEEMQAWCFFVGANSVFMGDRLLTTENCDKNNDEFMFKKLGLTKSEFLEMKC